MQPSQFRGALFNLADFESEPSETDAELKRWIRASRECIAMNAPSEGVKQPKWPTLRDVLGPGLITGASDDDPSGIATYSQAGAQFGYSLGWTLLHLSAHVRDPVDQRSNGQGHRTWPGWKYPSVLSKVATFPPCRSACSSQYDQPRSRSRRDGRSASPAR